MIEPDTLHGGGRAKTPTGLLRRGWIEPAGDGHALKDAGYAVIGVGRFQASRASALIEDAARPLRERTPSCRGFFRQGEVAFAILDAAEEPDCHEIAVPAPMTAWWRFFSSDVSLTVIKRQRGIPVVAVDCDRMPVKYPGH